jgi:hypothetical protein
VYRNREEKTEFVASDAVIFNRLSAVIVECAFTALFGK